MVFMIFRVLNWCLLSKYGSFCKSVCIQWDSSILQLSVGYFSAKSVLKRKLSTLWNWLCNTVITVLSKIFVLCFRWNSGCFWWNYGGYQPLGTETRVSPVSIGWEHRQEQSTFRKVLNETKIRNGSMAESEWWTHLEVLYWPQCDLLDSCPL